MLDSVAFNNGVFKTEKEEIFQFTNERNLEITKHYINTLFFIILAIFVENLNKLIESVLFRLNKYKFYRLYFYKKSF